MRGSFSFTCPVCGQRHEGSPSVAFPTPFYWDPEAARRDPANSKLNSDLCVIEERDFFIRCILEVPILGVEQPFCWGVWLTQGRENFAIYRDTFQNPPERTTFGYLANRLPGYPDTLNLEAKAHWRSGGLRPWIEIRESDHPLYHDWKYGISWERAIELAKPAFHH